MTPLESDARPVECKCHGGLSLYLLAFRIADEQGFGEGGGIGIVHGIASALALSIHAPEWTLHAYQDVLAGIAHVQGQSLAEVREKQREFVREWTAKYPAGARPGGGL